MDGKVTGLIKNREREVRSSLPCSSSIHPSFAYFAGYYCSVKVEKTNNIVPNNHHKLLHSAHNSRESKFRSSHLKSDREKKRFFFILCNDNDIIDMNNAMSATTFFFLFYNRLIFTPLQKCNVLSPSSLYCKNITI